MSYSETVLHRPDLCNGIVLTYQNDVVERSNVAPSAQGETKKVLPNWEIGKAIRLAQSVVLVMPFANGQKPRQESILTVQG